MDETDTGSQNSHESNLESEFCIVSHKGTTEPKLSISGNGTIDALENTMKDALGENGGCGDNDHLVDPLGANAPQQMCEDESTAKAFPLFPNVIYLGSASIIAPKTEEEIYKNMAVMNSESKCAINVNLVVPENSEGLVKLLEPESNSEISSYRIHRILFCARGLVDSPEASCFAFTCSHGEGPQNTIFQCHVFRTTSIDVVASILLGFAAAFRNNVARMQQTEQSCNTNPSDGRYVPGTPNNLYTFSVTMEFREDDGKGNFVAVPRDRVLFKLRCNTQKKIFVAVTQTTNKDLVIERPNQSTANPRNTKRTQSKDFFQSQLNLQNVSLPSTNSIDVTPSFTAAAPASIPSPSVNPPFSNPPPFLYPPPSPSPYPSPPSPTTQPHPFP